MIAKSNSPLSPDVMITINGVEVDYTSIYSFTLSLDENMHDMCTIRMRGIPPRAITDYIDAAVRVSLSSGPGRTQEFCGYVAYIEPTSETRQGLINGSPFQDADIVCLGASMVMKGHKSRVWENTSLSLIAQKMAKDYDFSLDVQVDPYAYPRIVQKAESDWEFLVRVARLCGARVSLHGTHLWIWDPYKALGRQRSYERLTTVRNRMDAVPGVILSFDGSFGLMSPDGQSTKFTLAALDKSGTIVSVSSNTVDSGSWTGAGHRSKFENFVPGTPQNTREAIKALEVADKETFAFNATVEVTAGAGIVPGGVVEVSEYNADFDGLWYVSSVKHHMGASQYITELGIGRDFTTTNEFSIPKVTTHTQQPDPTFKNNRWMSTNKRVKKYV